MIKFITFAGLRPGVDPDETWKYWREKHVPWAREKFLPEARKYTIGRVIHRFNAHDTYGVAQVWYDDLESALRSVGRFVSAPPDQFIAERIATPKRMLIEEVEVEL